MMRLALIAIIIFAIAPIALPLLLSKLGFDIGDESSSGLAAMPWFAFFTIPIGVVALIMWAALYVMLNLYR